MRGPATGCRAAAATGWSSSSPCRTPTGPPPSTTAAQPRRCPRSCAQDADETSLANGPRGEAAAGQAAAAGRAVPARRSTATLARMAAPARLAPRRGGGAARWHCANLRHVHGAGGELGPRLPAGARQAADEPDGPAAAAGAGPPDPALPAARHALRDLPLRPVRRTRCGEGDGDRRRLGAVAARPAGREFLCAAGPAIAPHRGVAAGRAAGPRPWGAYPARQSGRNADHRAGARGPDRGARAAQGPRLGRANRGGPATGELHAGEAVARTPWRRSLWGAASREPRRALNIRAYS